MEKKLIYKMIRNCFIQYNHLSESIPLSEKDYEDLYAKINKRSAQEPDSDLHEIVQDIVYDYLTEEGSPW
ncbi:YqzH family protein [Bacillus songklensis]|uniref:YqzH family protein n=1 Tax=Bacillus songklensis TaxID=1069116 RepID=A0ABV8AZ27_9BACI